jgi:hypothetical protein
MPTWPGTLPWEQFLGTDLTMEPAFIETAMDVGPPKAHAVYSEHLEEADVPIKLNGDQLQVFRTWFRDELDNGALPWTWEHPATDEVATYAFRAEKIKWKLDEGGLPDGRRMWSTTLPLRIIPA